MAISAQASATGSKTTTSGTTFTIALSSTAGDMVVVAVAMPTSTITVSSITDGGGNTYHRVGSQVNGTLTTELWKTDNVSPAASGTLTVTVSGTGARAAGVAESYRGVAFGGTTSSGQTGSTSPITSGSTTLLETTSWVVFAGGLAANNAFTAQNGSLRNQVGTTGVRAVLIDSNGGAGPVTDSATMTAATWAGVTFQLRPLEASADSLSMADGISSLFGIAFGITGEQLLFSEADLLEIGFQITDVIETMYDYNSGYGQGPYGGFSYGGAVTTGFDYFLSGSTLPLSRTLSDTLTLIDALGIGYGQGNVDQLVLADMGGVGYGDVIVDSLSWSDLESALFGMLEKLSDSFSLSDNLGLGYGQGTVDQLIFSDGSGIGYGDHIADSLSISESLGIGYGEEIVDQITLSDASGVGYGVLVSDAAGLNDILVGQLSIAESLSDTLTFSDLLGIGYGEGNVDQIILSDGSGVGYGDLISDSLNNWADQLTYFEGGTELDLTLADALSFSDAASILFTIEIPTETLTMSDGLGGGYGDVLSDTLSQSDKLVVGYGDQLEESLSLSDALKAGYGNSLLDSLSLSDALVVGNGQGIVEQLVFLESPAIGYGDLIAESIDFELDRLDFIQEGPLIQLGLSDAFVGMTDNTGAGYGDVVSETLSLTDSAQETLSGTELQLPLADTISMLEGLGAGYGSGITDTQGMTDAMGKLEQMLLALTEADINWLDSLDALFTIAMNPTETLSLVDGIVSLYGLQIATDSLSIVDSFVEMLSGPDLHLGLSEDLNAWLDFAVAVFPFTPTEITYSLFSVMRRVVAAQVGVEQEMTVQVVSVSGELKIDTVSGELKIDTVGVECQSHFTTVCTLGSR